MEHINKIELQGHVGTVRINEVSGKKVANFSLATEYYYKGRDGAGISETTWHNIVAWQDRDIPEFDKIAKGAAVNVCGRLRTNKYTNAEGVERQIYEVLASKVRIL